MTPIKTVALTKAQHEALTWLNAHNGTGIFTKKSHYQVVMAGGEEGPFMRSTWAALARLGLVTIEVAPGRRITATGKSYRV